MEGPADTVDARKSGPGEGVGQHRHAAVARIECALLDLRRQPVVRRAFNIQPSFGIFSVTYLAPLVAHRVAEPGLGTAPGAHHLRSRGLATTAAAAARLRGVNAVREVEVAAADVAGLIAESVADPCVAAPCMHECRHRQTSKASID